MSSRIYRTSEGHHVTEGDPRAAFLAYGINDEVPAEVQQEVTANAEPATQNPSPRRKPGRPPKHKAALDEHEDK